MKINILIIINILFSMQIMGQDKIINMDYILFDSVSINYKKIDQKKYLNISLKEFNSESQIAMILGKEYTKKKRNLLDNNSTSDRFIFKDFELDIDEGLNGPYVSYFDIRSPKYELIVQKGKKIYVGMAAKEVKEYFPFSSQSIKEGKSALQKGFNIMYISFADYYNGELRIWDKRLVLYIDNKTNKVSRIFVYNPI